MPYVVRYKPKRPYILLGVSLFFASVAQGCGSSSLDRVAEEQMPGYKQMKLGKFGGQVTVDGQPPAKDATLFVILTDHKNLDEAKRSKAKTPKLFAVCDADGKFVFKPRPGKYVVSFVELHTAAATTARGGPRKLGGGGFGGAGLMTQRFVGPDELKNLYNDPQKNSQQKEFNIDVQDPGRDDYQFNLVITGKEPVEVPSPEAWTSVTALLG